MAKMCPIEYGILNWIKMGGGVKNRTHSKTKGNGIFF